MSDTDRRPSSLSRRAFVAGAAAAPLVVKPRSVRGSEGNSAIALGMVASGNRAGWIANLFLKHGGYRVAAACDYFQDRVAAFGEKFQLSGRQQFTGLDGYQRLLETRPDAVVIESPPYFHPLHAMAAAEAGCHVFLAKPIAVDVPGCHTVAEASALATKKGLTFLVDFQTRSSPVYQDAVKRVHSGDIGAIVNGEAVYFAGPTWKVEDILAADPKNAEVRLRAWGIDRTLSGDIITEQNIHAIDVATWILDAQPLKAYGTGGKKGRTGPGTCCDHFSVIYYFPGDVVVSFTSKQFGLGHDDIGCRVYGVSGTIDTHYAGAVSIRGAKPMPEQLTTGLFAQGAVNNIETFHKAIMAGDASNSTTAPSVRSNLTTILGRTAAYRQDEVTWDELLAAQEKWEFDGMKGLRS